MKIEMGIVYDARKVFYGLVLPTREWWGQTIVIVYALKYAIEQTVSF